MTLHCPECSPVEPWDGHTECPYCGSGQPPVRVFTEADVREVLQAEMSAWHQEQTNAPCSSIAADSVAAVKALKALARALKIDLER